MPSPPEADDPIDEAFAAYLRSCDEGSVGSREEFLAQFPDMAEELESLMDAADAINLFTTGQSQVIEAPPEVRPADETVDFLSGDPDDSSDDPAATLPEANRPAGHPGPTLPFDLGDYELLEVVGRGGMGVVYRANQRMLNRTVAVKMIRGGIFADENDVRRFYTEAQAAAGLHHPGIVPVYQFGQRAGHHFFSMALIEGTDLQRRINEEQIPIEEAARYVRDVARALEHAHQNDVLHRDIKPANILIDKKDRVHITDFGLAKNLGSDSSVTGSGAAVGTPNYMAPEQAGGHSDRATTQTDIYSLGSILFAAVTGRPPLYGESVVETLLKVVHEAPPTMKSYRVGVPSDLETIVAKCLEKQPNKRYRNAGSVADDLDAFLEGRPIMARPRGRVIKTWHWLSGVPLVGALIGRKVVRATPGHRRFQAAMLLLLALSPFFVVLGLMLWNRHIQAMPSNVVFAGGPKEGVYLGVSRRITDRLKIQHPLECEVVETDGSHENRDMLIRGNAQLAPIQFASIGPDRIKVVAALFHETVHLLVRERTWKQENRLLDVKSLQAFKRIAVGPKGSGSRQTADQILDSLNIPNSELERVRMPWSDLNSDAAPDAVLICMNAGCPLVLDLLTKGWHLLELPNTGKIEYDHAALSGYTILPSDYPSHDIPMDGLATVQTVAFLATRDDTPDVLVRAALEVLYEPPQLMKNLLSQENTAEWGSMPFHSAAREYFKAHLPAEEE